MTHPVKPTITKTTLDKVDIRVGTIIAVNDIKKSEHLVQLIVDFGGFERSILVGIKEEREDLQALIGIQTLFVVNMAPKEMFGFVSEGMLFDIGYEDGILPALAHPERPVPNGVRLG